MFERLIKSHKYRDYSPIKDFTVKELREICDILNEYCKEHLGYRKSKGLPTYSVRNNQSGNYYGMYCPDKHKIYVYKNVTENLKKFVGTFIHEYTHSIQNLRYYQYRLVKYGYVNHPDEIEAINSEKEHYRSALKYLRKKI